MAGQDIDPFIRDYCSNLVEVNKGKLQLINQLHSTDPESEEFDTVCLDQFGKNDNKWFNPIIPHEVITYGDMCHAMRELYQELKKKKVIEFADAAIYSYVLIY